MARAKKKTLPKDIRERLKTESLEQLTAIFDEVDVDAYGFGSGKRTAIGYWECPDELIRWLVAHGADVDARDQYGRTPLGHRASSLTSTQIPLLIESGADVNALDDSGSSVLDSAAGSLVGANVRLLLEAGASVGSPKHPSTLDWALRRVENLWLPRVPEVAELLLAVDPTITPQMREAVRKIGERFEFHRKAFGSDGKWDAALAWLYERFGVPPVPRRVVHDGVSRIVVPAGTSKEQHKDLWNLLVPSAGPAATVQGEVIRATGRIGDEVLGNGGANWDRDYRSMLATLDQHLDSGQRLGWSDRRAAKRAIGLLHDGWIPTAQEEVDRLTRLSVEWVRRNPGPVPLPPPAYKR